MSMVKLIISRGISTSCSHYGKRNFNKFELINKRGSKIFKKMQTENPDPRYPIDHRGVRSIGYKKGKKFVEISERIPELIVPDLTGFKLKPYVSYRSTDVYQPEYTSRDLFEFVYEPKIVEDFKNGKLDAEGQPLEPSPEEKQTPQEAKDKASRTGTDLFIGKPSPLGTLFSDKLR